MKLAWIYAEKRTTVLPNIHYRGHHNATEKRSIKEYLENRTGETNVDNWFQVK